MPGFFSKLFSKEKKKAPLSKGELYDLYTEEIIQKVCRRTTNCIDIGANQGDILRIILKHAPEGEHHAFEPIPLMIEQLHSDFGSLAKVHIHDIALSDKKGTSSFNYVVSNPAYSGLIKREYARAEEEDTIITVKTDLLDNVLPADYAVGLIKIDVEGGELAVLKGAVNTLKKHKPVVVFEHGVGAADFYGTTPAMIYDLLTDCGMKIYTLTSWLGQSAALSKTELEGLFQSNEEYYFVADAN